MIDLSDICGFSAYYDEASDTIFYGDTVIIKDKYKVPLNAITPVLLNKFLRYPEEVYEQSKMLISEEYQDLEYNLIVIPYGLLGIEYVKTHIYYSDPVPGKYACMVEVQKGEISVLVQKNRRQSSIEFHTYVDDIKIIKLSAGDRICIPTGVFYTFINTGTTQAIFGVVSSNNHTQIDYSMLSKEKGLAFYVISKNARMEIVANPKYKCPYRPIEKRFGELAEDQKQQYVNQVIDEKLSLYQILQKKAAQVMSVLI